MTITFEMAIKKCVKSLRLFHFTKAPTKPSLNGSARLSNILHSTINFSSSYNINKIRWSSVNIVIIDYGKLPTITDDVMVVLVHKCVQQTHLLAMHLETLGYIPRLLNALNGLVYFLIIGDPRGDNLMVGSISPKIVNWSRNTNRGRRM